MPRLRSQRKGYTFACPACDSTVVYEREGRGNTPDDPDKPYRCENCSTTLLYVIERPKKQKHWIGQQKLPNSRPENRRYTARELSAKGPEDLGLSPIGVRSGQP